MTQDLTHVRTWIFDLDNTLYPPQARLFDQIEVRMTAFVVRELGLEPDQADALRKSYWRDYGTTLKGLMVNHAIAPGPYLSEVHDISFNALTPDPALAARIAALPGRKLVFTNGDRAYARKVLTARGLNTVFTEVFGVEETNFVPKPDPQAYDQVLGDAGIDPQSAAMFEDDPRNLKVPHERGMRTILVGPRQRDAPHLHHQTSDLLGFLSQVLHNAFPGVATVDGSPQ